jgi:nitronate monooxygenase
MLSADAMRKELETIAAHTTKPCNVNFFCHTPPTPQSEREAARRDVLAP